MLYVLKAAFNHYKRQTNNLLMESLKKKKKGRKKERFASLSFWSISCVHPVQSLPVERDLFLHLSPSFVRKKNLFHYGYHM